MWSDHEHQLGRISDTTDNWAAAMGGITSAAEDVESVLSRPAWVEHGRNIVHSAEAAHSYRAALGGVGAAASSISAAPIKEQAGEVEKATGKVKEHERAVESLGGAWEQAASIGIGFVAAATGADMLRKAGGASASAVHAEIAMKTAGMSPGEMAAFDKTSGALTAEYPQYGRTSIIDMLTRFRAQTGSAEHTIMAAPDLLKAKTIIGAEIPGGDQGFESIGVSLEVAGAFKDEPTLHKYLDTAVRGILVNKGTIRADDRKEFFQQVGGQYAPDLSQRFLLGGATTLMNEMGGAMAGTAIQSFENEVYRSTMYGRTAERFEKLGLLDESKIHRSKSGHIRYLDPGALKDWQFAKTDPDRWLNEIIMPALIKGIPDKDERQALFTSLWQTPPTARFAAMMTTQQWRSDRDSGLARATEGLDAFRTRQNDPGVAAKGLFAQTDNLLRSGGLPIMPGATGAMNVLAKAVNIETTATDKAPEINTGILASALGASAWLSGMVWNNPMLVGAFLKNKLGPSGAFATAWELGHGVGALIAPTHDENARPWDDAIKRWIPMGPRGIDDAAIERSRRARLVYEGGRFVDDPEAAHARALSAMKVDTSSLDDAQAKAKETGAAMKSALEQPIAPKVDSGSVDALEAKLAGILSMIGMINTGVGRMGAAPFGGVGGGRSGALHDGPEAR